MKAQRREPRATPYTYSKPGALRSSRSRSEGRHEDVNSLGVRPVRYTMSQTAHSKAERPRAPASPSGRERTLLHDRAEHVLGDRVDLGR